MFNDLALDKFSDFFPIFDFGRYWVQPNAATQTRTRQKDNRAKRDVWVALQPDSHVAPGFTGVIYITPSHEAIFWPMDCVESRNIAQARYLANPPAEIFSPNFDRFLTHDKLGALSEKAVLLEDRREMLYYFCGGKEASALLQNTLWPASFGAVFSAL